MRSWLVLAFLPFLSGCLAYGYPSVCRTPPVIAPEGDVRAFRVVREATASGPIMTGPITVGGEVEEIPVARATVESQEDAYFAYYYLLFPFTGDRSRGMRVLLYRPGYETVEIVEEPWWDFADWRRAERVLWKEVPDLAAREEALKEVVDPDSRRTHYSRQVLEFAAAEYARLAASPQAQALEMAETRQRLLAEAEKCAAGLRQAE